MSVEPSKKNLLRPAGSERRTDVRRIVSERYHVLVRYAESVAEDVHSEMEGIVTDVNSKGLGLILNHSLAPGAELEVVVQGHDFEAAFRAKAAWCVALPTCGRIFKVVEYPWRAGIELVIETDEEKALIAKILLRAT